MALAWEQFSGNAAATYNVTWVSNTVFTNVAKVTGVGGALLAYWVLLAPIMSAEARVKDEPSGAKAPVTKAPASSASSSYLPPSLKKKASAKDK